MTERHRHTHPFAAIGCALVVLVSAALTAPAAYADLNGLGPDESIQQANAQPALQPGAAYSGAFSSAQDIDYLAFEVTQPQTLRFTIENTLTGCSPYSIEAAPGEPALREPFPSCPMWGTLIEENGQQLGGEGSAAGTGAVEFASYEEIVWTFTTPGRYYLVLESDYCGGHLAECQLLTFKLSYGPPPSGGGGTGGAGGAGGTGGSGGGSTTGAGAKGTVGAGGSLGGAGGSSAAILAQLLEPSSTHSLIGSVALERRQHGGRVTVRVVLAQRLASLELGVLGRAGPHRRMTLFGHLLRKHPIAGRERIVMAVKRSELPAHGYLTLTLRIRAQGLDGSVQIIQRRVLLRR